MDLNALYGEFLVWLGQRFLGTGFRNVMVVMIAIVLVTVYFTGLYDKIVGRKENKGF